jgi:hypothetical protein
MGRLSFRRRKYHAATLQQFMAGQPRRFTLFARIPQPPLVQLRQRLIRKAVRKVIASATKILTEEIKVRSRR